MKKEQNKFKKYIKTLLLFLAGAVLIMQTGFILRKVLIGNISLKPHLSTQNTGTISNIAPTFCQATETKKYKQITASTPLYKSTTASTSEIIIMLPQTYYAQIIDTATLSNGESAYQVKYNGITGYAKSADFSTESKESGTMQSGITISLNKDAGTYLRTSPRIESNIQTIIPLGTTDLIFIGTINGDIPTDGTTDVWYYCIYNVSDTKAFIGYVYSQRCTLSKPLTNLVEDSSVQDNPITTTTSNITEQTTLAPKTNITKGIMWFIIILFTVPTLIFFFLLVKKPKTKKTDNSSPVFTDNSSALPLSIEESIPEFLDIDQIKVNKYQKPKKIKRTNLEELSPFLSFKATTETNKDPLIPNQNQVNAGFNQNLSSQNNSNNQSINAINFSQNITETENFSQNPNSFVISTAKTDQNSPYYKNSNTAQQNTTNTKIKPTKKANILTKFLFTSNQDSNKTNNDNNKLMNNDSSSNFHANNVRYDKTEERIRRRHQTMLAKKELNKRTQLNQTRNSFEQDNFLSNFKFMSNSSDTNPSSSCFFIPPNKNKNNTQTNLSQSSLWGQLTQNSASNVSFANELAPKHYKLKNETKRPDNYLKNNYQLNSFYTNQIKPQSLNDTD